MSTPASYPPPPPPGHPSHQAGSSKPPAPVRTATALLWAKAAFWVVSALVLLLVPAVRNQFVYSYGNPPPALGTGFLVLLAVFLTLVTLYVAVLLLLFRPASRRWPDERTAQRRWVTQQRRAATVGGAR